MITFKEKNVNITNASKIRRKIEEKLHFFVSPIKLTKRISINLQFLRKSGYLQQLSGKNFFIPDEFIEKGNKIIKELT
ncbi:MAG: hypothetical protein EAX96_14240 [Candidatus Lokiarchaeota archaeon]|nr:hypothetical protein [Candidatus Lokiarchaeota archaeon]